MAKRARASGKSTSSPNPDSVYGPLIAKARAPTARAEHRKIVLSSVDTGTYDINSPSVQPDMSPTVPSLVDLQKTYWTNPLAFKAVNLRADRIMGDGFKLKPADVPAGEALRADKAREDCERFLERINYKAFFRQSIINAKVAGNEWTELIYPDEDSIKLAKAPKSVLALAHGDFLTIDFRRNYINNRIILDGQGEPAGYMQFIPDLSVFGHTVSLMGGIVSSYENLMAAKERLQNTQALEILNKDGQVLGHVSVKPQYIYLQKDEIAHLAFNTLNDNYYGVSMLLPAYDSLVETTSIMRAVAEAVDEMGYPKPVVEIGTPERPASPNQTELAAALITDPKRKEGFVCPDGMKMSYLEARIGAGNINDYPQAYITLAATGLMTPKELLLGEGEANRATSVQGATDYDKSCEADRRVFERYVKKILGYFLRGRGYPVGDNGDCPYTPEIVWPELVTEEKALRQRLVMEKWQGGLITFNATLKALEEPEVEDPSRAEKYFDELKPAQAPMNLPIDQLIQANENNSPDAVAMHRLDNKATLNPALNDKFRTSDIDYKEIAQEHVGKEIVSVGEDTARKIRDTIVNETAQPVANLDKMRETIQETGDLERYQADRIIRTELSNLASTGRQDDAEKRGMKFRKWVAVSDSKTSDLCKALHGQVAEIDGNFKTTYIDKNGKTQTWEGKIPPAHPNCRSKMVYFATDPRELGLQQEEAEKIGEVIPTIPVHAIADETFIPTLARRTGIDEGRLLSQIPSVYLLSFGAGALSTSFQGTKEQQVKIFSALAEKAQRNKPLKARLLDEVKNIRDSKLRKELHDIVEPTAQAKHAKEYLGDKAPPEGVSTHEGPRGGKYYYTDAQGNPSEKKIDEEPKTLETKETPESDIPLLDEKEWPKGKHRDLKPEEQKKVDEFAEWGRKTISSYGLDKLNLRIDPSYIEDSSFRGAYDPKRNEIWINAWAVLAGDGENTLKHELAHALDMSVNESKGGHGEGWQKYAKRLGVTLTPGFDESPGKKEGAT